MSGPRRIEALVIGDELLDGRVIDTNTARFAAQLTEIGHRLSQRTTVLDDVDAIVREAEAVAARGTQLCVVSGGLGPTHDDRTAEAFAVLAGVGLARDEEHVRRIEAWLARRGRDVSENQRKQADRPVGSDLLDNPVGTAPGFSLQYGGCRFVVVPGIPREFDAMIESAVMTGLRASAAAIERRTLCTFGLIEAEVDARLEALSDLAHVRRGFRVTFPEIHVVLQAGAQHRQDLEAALETARQSLGAHVFAEGSVPFAAVVLDLLRQRGATLALAESCTGGLIGDLLTDIPGSSDVLLSGLVVYSNEAKQALLGVRGATLDEHGAVSEQTVLEMARGAAERTGATYAIAVSGIAGPGGGTPDKPVGTIWLAAIGPDLETTRMLSLPFERRRNKVVSAYSALDLVRRSLL